MDAAQKVWSGAELGGLSPAQDQAVFDAAVLTSLEPISPDFLARVRSGLLDQIAAPDAPSAG